MHVKADDVLTCSTQLTMQTVRMAAGEGLGRVGVCSLVASLSSGFQAGGNSTGEPAFCGPGTTFDSQEILMNANDLSWTDYRSADSYPSYVESHLRVDRIVKSSPFIADGGQTSFFLPEGERQRAWA